MNNKKPAQNAPAGQNAGAQSGIAGRPSVFGQQNNPPTPQPAVPAPQIAAKPAGPSQQQQQQPVPPQQPAQDYEKEIDTEPRLEGDEEEDM